jgi:serine/threonine protein kinase
MTPHSPGLANLPDPSDPVRGVPIPPPDYTIQAFIGEGGFGSVWKGEGAGIPCALKFIPLTSKVFAAELRAILKMRGVQDPNLVPLRGIWLRDRAGNVIKEGASPLSAATELVIAMGLGTGTLDTVLKKYRDPERNQAGIPVEELLKYMEQAAAAIDFLNSPVHDLGGGSKTAIYHCDIKPLNILTTSHVAGGGIWVCDFGIARFRRQEGGANVSVADHRLGLSPAYAPPELIQRKDDTFTSEDYKNTDQYSLAITYYQLRKDDLPFASDDAQSDFTMMAAHMDGRLDFSGVSDAEQAVLKHATAKRQSERFPSAVEMVRALRDAVPQRRRADSTGKISVASKVWLPKEGMKIVPGYELRKVRPDTEENGETWDAETDSGEKAVVQVVWPLNGDPGPVCQALDRMKTVRHDGIAQVLDCWLLDSLGNLLTREQSVRARALVIATRTTAQRGLLQRLDDVRQDDLPGIPRHELLQYVRQAAEALDALHASGIEVQHGGVRPENLQLDYPPGGLPRVVLTHFSDARIVAGGRTAVPRERGGPGAIYRPPESLAGERTTSCDQYGLAVTYYHLRAGRPPRAAYCPPYVMAEAIRRGELGLNDLPAPEREVIELATDRDQARRYPTCAAFVHALEECPDLPVEQQESPRRESKPNATIPPASHSAPDLRGAPYPTRTSTDTGKNSLPELPAAGIASQAKRDSVPAYPGDQGTWSPSIDARTINSDNMRTITRQLPDDEWGELPAAKRVPNETTEVAKQTDRRTPPGGRKLHRLLPHAAVVMVLACSLVAIWGTIIRPLLFPSVEDLVRQGLQAACDGKAEQAESKLNRALAAAQEQHLATDRIGHLIELSQFIKDSPRPLQFEWLNGFQTRIDDPVLRSSDRDVLKPFRIRLANDWVLNTVLPELYAQVKAGRSKQLTESRDKLDQAGTVEPSENIQKRITTLKDVTIKAIDAIEEPTPERLRALGERAELIEEPIDREPYQQLRVKLSNTAANLELDRIAGFIDQNDLQKPASLIVKANGFYPGDDVRKRAAGLERLIMAAAKGDTGGLQAALTEVKADASLRESDYKPFERLAQTLGTAAQRKKIDEVLFELKGKSPTAERVESVKQALRGLQQSADKADVQRITTLISLLDNATACAKNAAKGAPSKDSYRSFKQDLKTSDLGPGDQAVLEKVPAALEHELRQQTAAFIRDHLADLANNGSWEEYLDQRCLSAEPTAWVSACRVECLCELRRSHKRSVLDDALLALCNEVEPSRGDPEAAGYVTYVLALAAHARSATPDSDDKLIEPAKAMVKCRLAPNLEVPNRAVRVREILLSAVRGLRDDEDLLKPFVEKTAAPAIELLGPVSALEAKLQQAGVAIADNDSQRVLLALAERCGANPSQEKVRGLTAEFAKRRFQGLSPADTFCIASAHAWAQDSATPEGRRERLRAYQTAFELSRTPGSRVTPKILYEAVLLPGAFIGDQQPKTLFDAGDGPQAASALARLYSEIAGAIRSSPKEWTPVIASAIGDTSGTGARHGASDLHRLAVQLYHKAAQVEQTNNEQRAEYLVQEGYEGSVLPDADLQVVGQKAADAIQIASKYPGGYILKGIVCTLRSYRPSDDAQKIKLLAEAVDAYKQADQLSAEGDPGLKAMLKRARADTLVQLANYELTDRKDRLETAARLATEAADRPGSSYEDWRSAGNAREDVAWLVSKEDYNQKFEAAEAAFKRMHEAGREQAAPLVAQGRVLYKWAERRVRENAPVGDLLKRARTVLTESLDLPRDSTEGAEAHFWLARGLQLGADAQAQLENTLKEYEKAYKEADKKKASNWKEVVLVEEAELLLRQNEPKASQNALALGDRLEEVSRVQAARIRGRAFSRLGKRQEAWEAYGRGIAGPFRQQDGATKVALLRGRAEERMYSELSNDDLSAAVAEALEAYGTAKKQGVLNSDGADIACCAAVMYQKLRDSANAAQWYKTAVDDDPAGTAVHAWRARYLLVRLQKAAGQLNGAAKDDAIKLLDQAILSAKAQLDEGAVKLIETLRDSLKEN